MKLTLTGLVAAPHTPFRPDGALNLDAIPRIAALLAHNGVSGAFICGTTGEGCSLTIAERKEVANTWRRSSPAGLKLAVHVGHLCLEDSCLLAAHAEQIGADAVATIAPSFFRPASVDDLVEAGQHPPASAAPAPRAACFGSPAETHPAHVPPAASPATVPDGFRPAKWPRSG